MSGSAKLVATAQPEMRSHETRITGLGLPDHVYLEPVWLDDDREVAYAADVLPLAWLALFETCDIVEIALGDPQRPTHYLALVTPAEAAASRLARCAPAFARLLEMWPASHALHCQALCDLQDALAASEGTFIHAHLDDLLGGGPTRDDRPHLATMLALAGAGEPYALQRLLPMVGLPTEQAASPAGCTNWLFGMVAWEMILAARTRERAPRPYQPAELYAVDECIEHPTLGPGYVTSVPAPDRIDVRFQHRPWSYVVRQLVQGRALASP